MRGEWMLYKESTCNTTWSYKQSRHEAIASDTQNAAQSCFIAQECASRGAKMRDILRGVQRKLFYSLVCIQENWGIIPRLFGLFPFLQSERPITECGDPRGSPLLSPITFYLKRRHGIFHLIEHQDYILFSVFVSLRKK